MALYTVEWTPEDPITDRWYYCLRQRVPGIEPQYQSNFVHVSLWTESVKPSPGRMINMERSNLQLHSRETFQLHSELNRVNGTAPSTLEHLRKINPDNYEKMTLPDFELVPAAINRVSQSVYHQEKLVAVLQKLESLVLLPARVPLTSKINKLYPAENSILNRHSICQANTNALTTFLTHSATRIGQANALIAFNSIL
eukprot:sb/3470810/